MALSLGDRPRAFTPGRSAARVLRVCCALAALSVAACRYRPTQVTLQLDSNVARDRSMTLTIVTIEGAQSVEQLRAAGVRIDFTSPSRGPIALSAPQPARVPSIQAE